MTLTPDNFYTEEDKLFVHTQYKTAWQHDRMLQGEQLLDVVSLTYTGAIPNAGEQGTLTFTDVHTNVPCHYDYLTHEVIASSAGVYQPGAVMIVLYDLGKLSYKYLLRLEGELYRIVSEKYTDESRRSEITCNPYHDKT